MLIMMHTTHGGSQSPEYRIWAGIKTRCLNRNDKGFANYGGRGISICARWRVSFAAFLVDVGNRPFPGAQIERVDNDGDYEPGNVRWDTARAQANNRRSNRLLSWNGKTMTVAQWADLLSIGSTTLLMRLKRGWDVARVLGTPVDISRRNLR
jgi:hypothetical protein